MQNWAFTIGVEGSVDSFGEIQPARLRLGARVVDAAEILDRWTGRDHVYVKLRGSDGAIYIVRQDLARDHWQLVHFQVGLLPEAPSALREEPC